MRMVEAGKIEKVYEKRKLAYIKTKNEPDEMMKRIAYNIALGMHTASSYRIGECNEYRGTEMHSGYCISGVAAVASYTVSLTSKKLTKALDEFMDKQARLTRKLGLKSEWQFNGNYLYIQLTFIGTNKMWRGPIPIYTKYRVATKVDYAKYVDVILTKIEMVTAKDKNSEDWVKEVKVPLIRKYSKVFVERG